MTSDNEIEGDTLVTDRTLELAANTYAAADRLVRCAHPEAFRWPAGHHKWCSRCGAIHDGARWVIPSLVRSVAGAMIGMVDASERPTDPPPPGGEVSP
jgi:hypothetical protein